MKIPKKQIDKWVVEAIELVPKRFLEKMHNLVFVVDDRPTRLQIKECELRRGYALFGLYQGYEQTSKRTRAVTPDKISIFRKAIVEQYKNLKKIKEQVYKTVWHEIAHHFGSDEDGAIKAEHRMFKRYVKKQQKKSIQKRAVKKATKVKAGRRGYKRKTKVTFRVKEM